MTLAAKETPLPKRAVSGREQAVARKKPVGVESNRITEPDWGKPVALDISLIDEDPLQPRGADNPGFQRSSLEELAGTIKLRGVKTPISVRDNQLAPGRYIVNHGARRLRASVMAGKSTIPGFIDNDYTDTDQVIENLQRNELTPREVADFIGREMAKGIKRSEIARSIGKSAAFVTQHASLLDLPGPVGLVFNSGRVRDVTVVNELVTCYKLRPQDVTYWLGDETQDINRKSVKLLREFIESKQLPDASTSASADAGLDMMQQVFAETGDAGTQHHLQGAIKSPMVQVLFEEREARLLLHRRPSSTGRGWVKFVSDGEVLEVQLCELTLVAISQKSED